MVLIEMSEHVCGTGRARKAQLLSWQGTRGGWFYRQYEKSQGHLGGGNFHGEKFLHQIGLWAIS